MNTKWLTSTSPVLGIGVLTLILVVSYLLFRDLTIVATVWIATTAGILGRVLWDRRAARRQGLRQS